MIKKKRLFGGLLLTAGSVATALGSFLRNIIIARLISVEDFGIAATFALTVAMIEMCSNLAIDRLLVQAPDGEDEELQATAHSVQLAQGVVGAVVLLALAHPIAALFDIPDVVWAFQLLAAVPLIRGLSHLDRARMQRDLNFGPVVIVDSVPQIAATLVAIPAGYYASDYRAMLWVIFTQIILYTLLSHIVAKRRYSLAWTGPMARRAFTFGGPLLMNGFLMFGIFQGDRAIVGASFGMEELGWFSAAFAMTLAPSMLMAKVFLSFFLPQLSKLHDRPREFEAMSNVAMEACLLGGILIGVGFAVAGASIIELFYGERYMAGASVIALLGAMQALRTMRGGLTIVSIAKAQTMSPFWANFARSFGLLISFAAIWFGWGVVGIVIGSLAGELLATVTGLYLVHKKTDVSIFDFSKIFVLGSCVSVLFVCLDKFVIGPSPDLINLAIGCILSALAVAATLLFMTHTKNWLRKRI
jgi:O-antigen/teichoic acid export membrane protein